MATGITIDEEAPHRADLIPWEVRAEHGYEYALAMLRLEIQRRGGQQLRPIDEQRLTSWKLHLHDRQQVVHYDADTAAGFCSVPRRSGIDWDLIREPDAE